MKKYDTKWIEEDLESDLQIKIDSADVDLLIETLKDYGKETFTKYLEAIIRRYRFTNRKC